MKPRDIEALHSVSSPTVAPDGSRVVVAVSRPDLGANATVGQLWNVPLDGSASRRITAGRNDSSPKFSPSGELLAFVRGTKGGAGQLYVMDAVGGEPVCLTDAKQGVSDFSWSADSDRIAWSTHVPEAGRYGTVEGIPPAAEPARHITGLNYKYNGLGFTNDRRSHVFVLDVPALGTEPGYEQSPLPDGTTPSVELVPESVQVTDGDFSDSHPRFVGERIAFLSARHENRDRDLVNQLWAVTPGASPESLTDLGPLDIQSFEVGADGTVYLLAQDLGESRSDFVGRNAAVYRLDGRTPIRLNDPESIDATESDLMVVGERVIVTNRDHGRLNLITVSDSGVDALTAGDIEVTGIAAAGDTIAVSFATADSFGEVGILRNGVIERLTDFGAALRATGLVTPEELTVTGRDGYPVHGWVARPTGEGPHPTLLMIHGGPYSTFGIHAFDETQVYVDAGYAVVYCNPRGSAGYGQAHGRAIQGAMGGLDLADVLDFLDGALAEHGDLDGERLGILGGSYGGFLTAWTIAHDHRFRSAIVERGYLDPTAFVGSSDIGMMFPQQYHGADREAMRAQSPQEVAHLVTTPTLVIHSEEDLRCPIGQAETWYATLKLNGVQAEFLVFPGENHELSRSGLPRHRVQRFEAIVDWFGRTL